MLLRVPFRTRAGTAALARCAPSTPTSRPQAPSYATYGAAARRHGRGAVRRGLALRARPGVRRRGRDPAQHGLRRRPATAATAARRRQWRIVVQRRQLLWRWWRRLRRRGLRRMTAAYGVGIGWRPEIAGLRGRPARPAVRRGGRRVGARRGPVPRGARGPARARRRRWSRTGCGSPWAAPSRSTRHRVGAPGRSAAELLGAPLVSEHIAFVRAGGVEAGHLLPLPRTREAVDAVVANVAAHPGRAAGADRAGADRRAVRLARRRARRGASSSPRSWTAPTRCCCSTSPTCTPTPATGAPTRSRCSTRCRWNGSRTSTWPAAPSTTASTTTRTPTPCRGRCSTWSPRCASGAARRRCCWSATATTRRPTTCAPSWTRSPPPSGYPAVT